MRADTYNTTLVVTLNNHIYAGNMLIAEYKPQVNQYYYYTPDQINSVRMVTNNSGDVVYSAAYSPFGEVHKEWVNAYSPELKFSGKEREGPSGLDYFGARYYGNFQYRFLSVDPAINRDEAIMNPQLWNLYAYCRNNPITFMDPDGKTELFYYIERGLLRIDPQQEGEKPYYIAATSGKAAAMNNPRMVREKNKGPIPQGEYEINAEDISDPGIIKDYIRNMFADWGDWRVKIEPKKNTETLGRKDFFLHEGSRKGSAGCIDIGGGKYGNKTTDRVARDLKRDPDKRIPLWVK